MSRNITKQELSEHKNQCVKTFDDYIQKLIDSDDENKQAKADKLSFWLKDWASFLKKESYFQQKTSRRYKRGDIIKLHLGFNIGNEEGGLHYAVVLDKNDSPLSKTLTVVPLTSVKPHTNISRLKKGSVYLGSELFDKLNLKISTIHKTLYNRISKIERLLKDTADNIDEARRELMRAQEEDSLLDDMRNEILKMKSGSIAITNQITTISKIRIYNPVKSMDILSGIKMNHEKLDLIDLALIKQFTK